MNAKLAQSWAIKNNYFSVFRLEFYFGIEVNTQVQLNAELKTFAPCYYISVRP